MPAKHNDLFLVSKSKPPCLGQILKGMFPSQTTWLIGGLGQAWQREDISNSQLSGPDPGRGRGWCGKSAEKTQHLRSGWSELLKLEEAGSL